MNPSKTILFRLGWFLSKKHQSPGSINSEHLEVEESINCQRDALTLTALAPNKKQIGRFCGEKGTIQQEMKSDANDVIIVFKQGLQLELENSIFKSQ